VASRHTLHVTEWNGHNAVLQLRCWTPNGDCYQTRSDTGELIEIDHCNAVEWFDALTPDNLVEPLNGEPPWLVAIEWTDDGPILTEPEDYTNMLPDLEERGS